MRITFVLPFASLSGGVRVVATYARHLVDAGHVVTVVSRPREIRKGRWGIWATRLKQAIRQIRQLRWEGVAPATPLLDFLGPRHVVLDRFRPVTAQDVPDADVVIATWWETAQSVADFPAAKGRKFYLLQDYEIFDTRAGGKVVESYALPLHKMAVSGYIRDCLADNHGVTDITLLPNAVDTVQFDAPPRDRGRPLTVGFLYSRHPRKRVELAVEAVRLARQTLPDLRVIVFGQTAPEAEFGFSDWIDYRIAPPQDEIPHIYAACDVWLFPSRSEGFGLPLLEAMACRTPVLATDAGAASDLIDGTNGRIVEPTPEAFVAAITAFATMTDADWRAASDAAWHRARAYSWDDATRRLVEIIGADRG